MSDSKTKVDKMIGKNPRVDRTQLEEAQEALTALRRAGLTGPSYRIDSPYERGPTPAPATSAEDEVAEQSC